MEVLLSNNNYGFQKILDDFKDSIYINIVTYNISSGDTNDELLDLLKSLENKTIRIITNIPKRFPVYFNASLRTAAYRNIKRYLEKLEPSSFKSNVEIYFNFKNHSKIYSTKNYTYIGSQNFSDESKNNYEVGIVINNKEIGKNYGDDFIEELIYKHTNDTIRFYGMNIENLKEEIQNKIKKIYEIFENINITIDDYFTGYEFICEVQNKFKELNQILSKIYIIFEGIMDSIKKCKNTNKLDDVEFIETLEKNIENKIERIEEILYNISADGDFSEVYFDINKAVLENIYDADEENLEKAIIREMESAYNHCDYIRDRYESIIYTFFTSFKEEILELISITKNIEEITSNYEIIDNTF